MLAGTEAVHYAMTSGLSGDDYTGVLSILAGLLLLGLGTVTLWRSRRGGDRLWRRYGRRLLLAAGTVLVAGVVLFSVCDRLRHHPRLPRAGAGRPTRRRPRERPLHDEDGLVLEGWYIPSRNGAAVIAFPGRASSQDRAKLLARHGYGVLLFDRRGEGESEGDPNLFGWQGDRDIHAAVAYLQGRPDVDPDRIGGIGLSVGGEMMIEAAAESSALKAIVSEGASSRSVRDELANRRRPLGRHAGRRHRHRFDRALQRRSAAGDPGEFRAAVSGAVFFVYGEHGQPAEEPANTRSTPPPRGRRRSGRCPGRATSAASTPSRRSTSAASSGSSTARSWPRGADPPT